MPANDHLQWAEVSDFSPGLWQVGDWLVPAHGAQEMVDCYPQKGSGLRAFFKPGTLTTSGLNVSGAERVIGFYGYYGPHRTSGSAHAVDFYCMTYTTADGKPRLYRYDTTDFAVTGWSLMHTFGVNPNASVLPIESSFMAYKLANGDICILVSLGYGHSDSGIWGAGQAIATGSQTWSKVSNTDGSGPMCAHQNRLVFARGSVVWFSGPGDETIGASNFVQVEPQRNFANIVTLIPASPGDLLIGKEGAAWSTIQGALTDPTVLNMSDAHTPAYGQQMADIGQGMAFIEPGGGIYATAGGSSFSRLDTQLTPLPETGAPADTAGDLAFFHNWLFVRGRVFDLQTQSWFRTSFTNDDPAWIQWVDKTRTLYAIADTSQTAYAYIPDENTGARCSDFVWKSASLRDPSGRQVEVREVQVICKNYVNTSGLVVTVNGTARSAALGTTGRQMVSFLFHERAEVLDVKIESGSNGSAEAPSIESVRIGTRAGHRTH